MILGKNTKAQSTIEFTFGLIVVLFLIFGMVRVLRWAGMDLANRRVMQDNEIIQNAGAGDSWDPGVAQLTDHGDSILPMAAVYHGEITNSN